MIRLATLAALVGVATAQFCTDAVPGAVVFSDHDAANNGRHSTCTADQTADFPDAAYYVLSNGDTAWASSNYGTGCSSGIRDAAQAFDGSTNAGWNWAFHGACHQGDDWRTTSVRLRYSWQTGGSGLTQGIPAAGAQEETVAAVSVFQTPAGHSTGRVEVHFLAPDGTVQPVTNPSSAGFESTAPGTELQITFDAVRTSMIEIQMWAHDDTGSDICVGAAEVAICGLLTSDCAGEWACTAACEAGADRVWAESTPQAGTGAACPTAPPPDAADCASGEGACVLGCTDEGATNYDAAATRDDGSCVCDGFRMMQHGRAVCSTNNGDMDGDQRVTALDIMSLLGDYGMCDPRLISDGNDDGCVGVQDLMLLLELFGTDYFCSGHGTRGLASDPCVCADFLDSNGVSVGAPWAGENCEAPPGGALFGVGWNVYGPLGIGTVGGNGGYGQPGCRDGGGCGVVPNLVRAGPCNTNGQCAPGCNLGCTWGSWGARADGRGVNCNVQCTPDSPQATQFDNNDLLELYATGPSVIVKRSDGKFFHAGYAIMKGTNNGWDGSPEPGSTGAFQPNFNTVYEEIATLEQWDIASLKGAAYAFYALTTTGGVIGWGEGIPNVGRVRLPMEIDFVGPGTDYGPVSYIGARQWLTAYILESGGVVMAGSGYIGDGTRASDPSTLLTSVGNDNVQIELGGDHALLLKADGSVMCWGNSDRGQCGTPGHNRYDTPIVYPNLPPIKQVEASRETSYFLSVDGEIWASGQNNQGQLGKSGGDTHTAQKIDGYPTDPNQFLIDVQEESDHVIVVQPDGTVYGSGQNMGSCLTADGSTDHIYTAQQLTGLGTNIFAAGAAGETNKPFTVVLKRGD